MTRSPIIARITLVALTGYAVLVTLTAKAQPVAQFGASPPGFSSANVQVNGSSLHYVRGGNGPAVILVHGFPEDWVEYRAIMPRLAERFTIVAVDLPGIGRSEPANGDYDAANLAADIHGLAETLKLDRPYIVGHDLGWSCDLRLCPPVCGHTARGDDPRRAYSRSRRLG